jgi:2-amino-4-hydroxy-6-hydroxymethyldihydropteridine diphosphokinase
MSRPVIAFVGIGSNLDGPGQRVRLAVRALSGLPDTRLTALSSWYRNPPMGPADQPYYLNGVAALETTLSARALFGRMLAIESEQGRRRHRRWGPRTLDLDLLAYGDLRLDDSDLVLPHPGLADRAFVLVPLAEIAPDAVIPGLGVVKALRDALAPASRQAMERVAP